MTWEEAVKIVGDWYQNNVNTYEGKANNKNADKKFHWRDCSLLGVQIQDDCGGFVSACLAYAGVTQLNDNGHTTYTKASELAKGESSKFATTLKNAGFVTMTYNESSLQPYDIVAGDSHTEIFAGNGKAYGWGNNNSIAAGIGLPINFNRRLSYKCIWRMTGQGNFTAVSADGSSSGTSSGTSNAGTVSGEKPNTARPIMASRGANTVYKLSGATKNKGQIPTIDEKRRERFNKMVEDYYGAAPELGRNIIVAGEFFNAEILKGDQESKTFNKG